MPFLQDLLLTAALFVMAFTPAEEPGWEGWTKVNPIPNHNVVVGSEITIQVEYRVSTWGQSTAPTDATVSIIINGHITTDALLEGDIRDWQGHVTGVLNESGYVACRDIGSVQNRAIVTVFMVDSESGRNFGPYNFTYSFVLSCGVQIATSFIDDLAQIEVCGPNNDVIAGIDGSVPGAIVHQGVWSDGTRIVELSPVHEGNSFAPGTTLSRTFIDNGSCQQEITQPLTPPIITQVCGANNDLVTPGGTQPEGVVVTPQTSFDSDTGVTTLTYSAAEQYVFADGYNNVIQHTDQGDNCPVLTVEIDGTTFLDIPTEGTRTITGTLILDNADPDTATPPQLLLNGTPAEFQLAQQQDVNTWAFEWTASNEFLRATCGTGGIRVEASAGAAMYGVTNNYAIEPFSTLCSLADIEITQVIPQPVVLEQCGPANDIFNNGNGLPTGVDPEFQLTWDGAIASLTYSPLPGYVFADGYNPVITVTDEIKACDEPATIGKQMTVYLNTSDGGSIEGTPYQVFAPTASQVGSTPYAEGWVGADNRILLDGLLAGDYRLKLAPAGYEPVDAMLTVTAVTEAQVLEVKVAALQIPTATAAPSEPTETSDPTGTAEPTNSVVTPAPTETYALGEPAPNPAPTVSAVTQLPETGTGAEPGSIVIGLAGLLAAAMIALVVGGRHVRR